MCAVDAGFFERLIENAARRPDEWMAGDILLVARLFADHQQGCLGRPFSRYDLRRIAVQRTARARLLGRAQLGKRPDQGDGRIHGQAGSSETTTEDRLCSQLWTAAAR